MSFWGGLFPVSYWGWLFPEDVAAGHVDGIGPAGQFVFALSLIDGAKLTWSWLTDIFKAYDGSEKRAATIDQPKTSISGQAYLIGSETRATRAALARYAASGQPFALGLPYEAIAISEPTEGAVVTVPTTLNVDWIGLGQRVIVQNDDTAIQAVIQDFDATTVTLDVSLGSLGDGQCILMPSVAIYLDAQQGFARYTTPDGFETWSIQGTFAAFGFPADARAAQTGLLGATCPSLGACSIAWWTPGTSGNTITIQFIADGGGSDTWTRTGNAYIYHFTAGTTTVAGAVTTLAGAGLNVSGSFSATDTLTSGDAFGPLALGRGVDASAGSWGRSATVATHQQMPVWDRPIQVSGSDGTASDSVQAMNELLDLDGALANIGTAAQADWGRQVSLTSDQQAEWQWLKLFLATARGCARTWWLPSWRSDLEPSSHTADTITIAGPSLDAGDFFAWYPTQRKDLQVQQADGTITYVTITAAVDNGDGTITLTIETDSVPIMATAAMAGALGSCTLEWNTAGAIGNGMTLVVVEGSPILFPPTLLAQDSPTEWRLTYNPSYAVAADIVTAATIAGFVVIGSYTPTDALTSADAATYVLSGGADPTEAATLSDADIVTLSWLELCRFEADDQQIAFHPGQFELTSQARAVQQ